MHDKVLIISRFTTPLQTRSTTFSDRAKPAVKNTFQKSKAYKLRSGTYASYESANPNRSNQPNTYSGWRGGCLAAAISAGTVLLINIIFTIWAAETSKSGTHIGTIHAGDCGAISKADSWLHIAINIMGTLLLGASNYTMQCLSSPTRKEVDAAHSTGRYLDIGLPSLRNLNGWKKKILFNFVAGHVDNASTLLMELCCLHDYATTRLQRLRDRISSTS
jgi:hypothetical protein